MKAEEILKNHLIGYEYILGNLQSSVINAMKEYARIQIDKDRERVKETLRNCNYILTDILIDNTPINLD